MLSLVEDLLFVAVVQIAIHYVLKILPLNPVYFLSSMKFVGHICPEQTHKKGLKMPSFKVTGSFPFWFEAAIVGSFKAISMVSFR